MIPIGNFLVIQQSIVMRLFVSQNITPYQTAIILFQQLDEKTQLLNEQSKINQILQERIKEIENKNAMLEMVLRGKSSENEEQASQISKL